ncbi:MAG: chorismate mutase [Prevotellaceae bacterium]|nr:chorismate mutase [Candidatus Minthosoma caballi]
MVDNNKRKLPHECTNITEVRNEIDNIDSEIIKLLSTRFGYVREVVKYKEKTDSGIEATDRRAAVIDSRRKWAEEEGINPDVIENIYNTLIDYFIIEEKKIMQN